MKKKIPPWSGGWSGKYFSVITSCYGTSTDQSVESADSAPTLHILAKIAMAFDVSADLLVFENENGAAGQKLDSELLTRFQRVVELPERERDAVIILIDSVIAKQAIREVIQG